MSQDLVKQEIHWIETNAQLERVCDVWQDEKLLAIDTEFMRSQTYYPIPGLIQVNDGKSNYLIDPTKIDDFFPLTDIFENDSILKVLHSCSEDLEVFHHGFACLPKSLLDTQLAAALSGYAFSLGFANLVREVLDVDLPKGETRSDWLQRPLSVAQVQYAAMDVEYLYAVAIKLISQLTEHGRLEWAMEDSKALITHYYENQNCDNSYLRFKSAWKLSSRQLAVLQTLCRWREDKAQDKNLPRNRIIKEPALMTIAQRNITTLDKLRHVEGVSERMVRENGVQLMQLVAKANDLPAEKLPPKLPKPLSAAERELLQSLKDKVSQIAGQLNVPVESLVKKKDYEQLINSAKQGQMIPPVHFDGWRKDVVASELEKLVTAHYSAGTTD
ncbi:Ribonuclease D [Thalassocella blandensis]|nr:Ribonuclease D [Thalassocella blandensis]